MAPKRPGDRYKKNAALRSKEAREKNRVSVEFWQSSKLKLTAEIATLHALHPDGQKSPEQLKDRVSMQGSCFLAIESFREELGACWYYTTYNKQHHQEQHKHQQPTPTPTSIHVHMCRDLFLVLVSFECSCSRSYTDQNSALAENAVGWQNRRLLFSSMHVVFGDAIVVVGVVWLVNPPT
jgi:hypothetical protein